MLRPSIESFAVLPQNSLVEILGIEPSVPEGGGFTVHGITIDASSPKLVGNATGNRTPLYGMKTRYPNR